MLHSAECCSLHPAGCSTLHPAGCRSNIRPDVAHYIRWDVVHYIRPDVGQHPDYSSAQNPVLNTFLTPDKFYNYQTKRSGQFSFVTFPDIKLFPSETHHRARCKNAVSTVVFLFSLLKVENEFCIFKNIFRNSLPNTYFVFSEFKKQKIKFENDT